MRKIAIIGASGSGKSYLAKGLGVRTNLPVYHLDDVILEGKNEKPPVEIYRSRVEQVAEHDKWIIEGVFPKVGDIVWGKADVVIWLNLSFNDIRQRYDERENAREHIGAFSDPDVHRKEYKRLTKVYSEMLGELSVSRVIELNDANYTADDVFDLF